jgi:hypothetical protein
MKGWHIGFAVIVAIVLLACAPLVFAAAPFTVVCEAAKLSIHKDGVVYRITGISCARLVDA